MNAAELARALYLPPGWIALDAHERLELTDCLSGERVELTGELRAGLLAGDAPAALAALARVDARLLRLSEALQANRLTTLDRAALLRGEGYGQLFVELTARCNERCVHCYADSSPERGEALDWRTLRAVLEDARELGFASVQLTGGDPLISPHCLAAVTEARALGIPRVEIYTNGLALNERMLAELAPFGVAFAFSFYAADPTVHDAITRTHGSQTRTLAAIRRALASGSAVRVSVIVMDQNRYELASTQALLREIGVAVDAISSDVQRSVGRGLMTIRPKDSGIAAPLGGHRAPVRSGFEGRAAVSYDGTVFPCIFSRSFALGNVHERRLRDVLREPVPLSFSADALFAEFARCEEQLACTECRLRGALLGMQAQSP